MEAIESRSSAATRQVVGCPHCTWGTVSVGMADSTEGLFARLAEHLAARHPETVAPPGNGKRREG